MLRYLRSGGQSHSDTTWLADAVKKKLLRRKHSKSAKAQKHQRTHSTDIFSDRILLFSSEPQGLRLKSVFPCLCVQRVQGRAPHIGPTASHPDSLAGQAGDSPALHKSLPPLQCLAWKTQKYLPRTHQACFCWPGLTLVRKPQCLFPVCTALSAEANL